MKPAHQWETRRHRAYRSKEPPGGIFRDDRRAEAFELRFDDGTTHTARLGLARQEVDEPALQDPDLPHAVRCWLAARGARRLQLWTSQGRMVEQSNFQVRELADTAPSAERLVTLCPSNAEMVHALGAFDRVVACEDSSDYPPQVADLPRLGPDLGPDLDRVAELAPDLVISSLSVPGMERNVTGLRARGVAQAVLAPRRLGDVLEEAVWLGEVLGIPEAGQRLRARMQEEIRLLEQEREGDPARVYLEWWPKPMFTPGADCYSNELIALAGGVNVFGSRAGSSIEISAADLNAADPEVCFVSWCGVALDKLDPQNLVRRPGLEALGAARAGRVHPLDEAFSGRPGPRMLEAARVMAKAIRGHRAPSPGNRPRS